MCPETNIMNEASVSEQPETSPHLQFSADFRYINAALHSRWQPFLQLEREEKGFIARPAEDFLPELERLEQHLRNLNPTASGESIRALVEGQHKMQSDPRIQFVDMFSSRHMVEYVTLLMLGHALCEALANAILALGLNSADNSELFTILESASLENKWCVAPKAIRRDYSLPKDSAVYETLKSLISQRNTYVHSKIELYSDGKRVLEDSKPKRRDMVRGLDWMRRYFSLPYDLAAYTCKNIGLSPIYLALDRGPIEPAIAHNGTP